MNESSGILRARARRECIHLRKIGGACIPRYVDVADRIQGARILSARIGKDRSFAVTLLVGIVVLFAGFLVTVPPAQRSARADLALAPDVAS